MNCEATATTVRDVVVLDYHRQGNQMRDTAKPHYEQFLFH